MSKHWHPFQGFLCFRFVSSGVQCAQSNPSSSAHSQHDLGLFPFVSLIQIILMVDLRGLFNLELFTAGPKLMTAC